MEKYADLFIDAAGPSTTGDTITVYYDPAADRIRGGKKVDYDDSPAD